MVAALTMGKGSLDYAGLGIVALSFGLVVALVIYALGTISGAHINPAVTVALAVTRRFRWAEVPAYVGAQLVGAVVGAFLVVGVAGTKAATAAGVGLTSTAPGVGSGQAVLAEGLGTFLLLFTIMAVAVDRRAPVGWLPHRPGRGLRDLRHRAVHRRIGQPRPHLRPLSGQRGVRWCDALG